MNYKRCLFVVLAGAVLLVPVTSHYAISLQDIKDNISKFFSGDTFKKIAPGAFVLAIFGGLYYWLTKKRGDGDSGERKTSLIEQHMSSLIPKITQFNVYSQLNYDGGGAASCGYQTLLRGMQVVNGVATQLSKEQLKYILMQTDEIIKYFNFDFPQGIWREKIIERRKIVAITELVKKILFEALRKYPLVEHPDLKIVNLYQSIINRDIKPELLETFEKRGSLGEYQFTKEDFVTVFMKSDFKPENEKYIEIIKDPYIINAYVDLDKIVNELSNMRLPTIKDSHNGDWLLGHELVFLWEEEEKVRQEGKSIISNIVDCEFIAIDDFSLIGKKKTEMFYDEHGELKERETSEDIMPIVSEIRGKLKRAAEKQKNYFHLFGMGIMSEAKGFSQAEGHWFALVLYQHSDGSREYFVTDSMNNRPRNNDDRVITLINAIEAKEGVEAREEI